ncbi:membrane-spanning 4-domains subfamily A member 6A-like [Halichoeres trimaculatus]|uniref:membrane-spanning 4-domains subfamily A member 6A-like n=1 Tax=Halichoeres trimaculatus TaxID=147232 RepID=UPI003D9EEBD8
MSVTMTKSDGVTVLTLTSDPQSSLPPICQILKSLCYSPVCCSVSQHLKKIQGSSQSVLGTLMIMAGLLNIGLGAIVNNYGWDFWFTWHYRNYPFIFGGVFIFFGAMNILSEKCPSLCLVILNIILNVTGAAMAITTTVIYSINIAHMRMGSWYCDDRWNTTPSPDQVYMKEKCLEALHLAVMLLRSMNALLIILSVLKFCVTFSSAVLGFKALRCSEEGKNKSPGDPEWYQTLPDEIPNNSTI